MKKAFTLIELLVVIAIIAILAALLFPVFAGTKAAAKKTMCLSNLKGLGTAFALYLSDADGTYPACDNDKAKIEGRPPEPEQPEADGPPERDWTITIQPYLKNFDVLRCPTDTSLAPKDPKNPDLTREFRSSYTINGWAEYDLKEGAFIVIPAHVMHRGYAVGETPASLIEIFAPVRNDYIHLVDYQDEEFGDKGVEWVKPEWDSWNRPD